MSAVLYPPSPRRFSRRFPRNPSFSALRQHPFLEATDLELLDIARLPSLAFAFPCSRFCRRISPTACVVILEMRSETRTSSRFLLLALAVHPRLSRAFIVTGNHMALTRVDPIVNP